MANLLETSWVQNRIPEWKELCTIDETELSAEALLELHIEMAEDFIGIYYTLADADDLTDQLKLIELWVVHKMIWDLQHSQDEWENEPPVVANYNQAVDLLHKYQSGELPNAADASADDTSISFAAKDRIFGGPNNYDGNLIDWNGNTED